jgi:hypothetical protein
MCRDSVSILLADGECTKALSGEVELKQQAAPLPPHQPGLKWSLEEAVTGHALPTVSGDRLLSANL